MQKNSNFGCVYLLVVFGLMSLLLWWGNERQRQGERVRNERWEQWRQRMVGAKEKAAVPRGHYAVDSAAAKEMERRIWAEAARSGAGEQNDPDYYQDHYEEYKDDPEDELRFPPEIFDASDD
ncbi:MAG: hypothetical protein IJV06_06725 [Bacteroidaceae bacterium]|nr:hypothetical protein [Bacteroidaceae bacterium]